MPRKPAEAGGQSVAFTARVKLAGINPYVDVPAPVVEAVGQGRKSAVLIKLAAVRSGEPVPSSPPRSRKLPREAPQLKTIGRLGTGGWFRSTLVPSGSRATRLYLDTWMREAAAVGVGDQVRIWLRPDLGSRELPMPPALRRALAADALAKATWDALAPSRRKEILTYLNFLKTPAALERRVQKTLEILLEQARGRG